MGNVSNYDTEGNELNSYSYFSGKSFIDAETGLSASFKNLGCFSGNACVFWYAEQRNATNAWVFSGENGFQFPYGKNNNYSAWAVRNGDVLVVNEVPVPAAAWLMGSGLIGLAGIARRKK